jgi:hypothetical protein
MGKLSDISKRLARLTPGMMREETLNAFTKNESSIVDYNTEQLMGGQDSKGENLPNYSPGSVARFGKPPGPIKLFDSGDFHNGFFVRKQADKIIFDSRDEKTDMLKNEYGADIFGLQPKNLNTVVNAFIKPYIQSVFKKAITG